MDNKDRFIKEANSMLVGMAPHVASRKTANMLRTAVEMLTADNRDNDCLINDLNHQIEGFKEYIEIQKKSVKKLQLESFDIWRFENTINIVRADGEAGGFDLDSFDKCVNKFFDNNF